MSTTAWLVAGTGAFLTWWGALNLFGVWLRHTAIRNEAERNPAPTDAELLQTFEYIKKANREREVGCGCLTIGAPVLIVGFVMLWIWW